jgi:hypothetical protein
MILTMTEFAEVLPQLKGKDLYLYLSKECPDWTSSEECVELVLHYGGKKASLSLADVESSSYLASSLYHFIDENSVVMCWGIKDLFTYLKGKTEIDLEMVGRIYDISIICSYFGFPLDKPKTFNSAAAILRAAMNESGWTRFCDFYRSVYRPLFSKVMPDIETHCLIDNAKRRCVYPTYVIEGQINGRLKAVKNGLSSYNPHSIGANEKANLRPKDYDEVFVYFDYKNMEVNVLQWLSRDAALAGILDSGKDLYREIWSRITQQDHPTDSHRTLCKNIFLPVVFGQGARSLSKKLGIKEEIASKLIYKLNSTFPVAFDWVNSQTTDGNNTATDVFGRRRKFEDHELYKIKNFCIQSPASMICLRKLVRLHEALSGKAGICFHVHDGYCVLCNKNEVGFIQEIGSAALEEEDPMFPGLRLKTTCKFGHSLNDMQNIKEGVPA